MQDINTRISSLDLTLYDGISSPTQTSEWDKRALLSIQRAVRDRLKAYTYLEIGSYHGGSIQPHLLDPLCKQIYSIDKRPKKQYDERGTAFGYPEGSTQIMMEKLKAVSPENIGKIKTFDMDASEMPDGALTGQPDLFFIDGEHTDKAVISDFQFVYSVIKGPAVISFHDAHLVFRGLSIILADLEKKGVPFTAYALPNCIFVIELNGFGLHQDPGIKELLINNHLAYLPSLNSMYKYRDYCHHFPVRIYVALFKSSYRLYSKTLRPFVQKLKGKK